MYFCVCVCVRENERVHRACGCEDLGQSFTDILQEYFCLDF